MRLLFILLLFIPLNIFAQDDELDLLLDKELSKQIEYESATFKATRIINGHSIERMQEGELDFRVSHRFDRIDKGFEELFGLDNGTTLLSLEYGITDWMMLGIARTNIQKTWHGFLKFSILRQTKDWTIPLSLSYFSGIDYRTNELLDSDPLDQDKARTQYTHQLLLARKFSENLSFQLSPTLIHRNLVEEQNDNDLYALGIGARYKLSNWVAISAEYFYCHNKDKAFNTKYYDSFSIGFDIETGGHVFQVFISNAVSSIESGFIANTTDSWSDGGIHLGFHISRVFTIY